MAEFASCGWCRVSWFRSRLFWQTTSLWALLSAVPLMVLHATVQARLKDSAERRQKTELESDLSEVLSGLEQGTPPESVMRTAAGRMARHGRNAWLVTSEGEEVAGTRPCPSMATVSFLIETVMAPEVAIRRVSLDDPPGERLAAVVPSPGSDAGAETQFVIVLADLLSPEFDPAPMSRLVAHTTIWAWLIGVVCTAILSAVNTHPLRTLTRAMTGPVDATTREDLLLGLCEQDDDVGRIARAIRRQDNDAEQQLSQNSQFERSARASADLLAMVLDSLVEGVVAVDAGQRIVYLNSSSRRLLTLNAAIQAGHRLYEAVRVTAFVDCVSDVLSQSTAQSLEFRSGPDSRELLLTALPMIHNDSPGAVAVIRDISETRRLEAMRRDFISGVSHELKTPLTVIQACADTLLAGAVNDPPAAERFLNQINEQSDRLLKLIVSMLHLARIESGQQAFDRRPVDLDEVTSAVVDGFLTVADGLGIRVLYQTTGPVLIESDEQAVRTILGNLIDNALKHTPRDGSVTVELRQDAEGTDLIVRDTGEGIPEELLGRIFERFYRVEPGRTRDRGGSGLGLAIVKHLCQGLGATVGVRSELRRGSEFRIHWPAG